MTTQPIGLSGGWRPEGTLETVFLQRCAKCAEDGVITPHPKAANPGAEPICPVCKTPSTAGPTVTVSAVLTGGGPSVAIGRAFLAIGRLFLKFAKEG